MKTFKDICSLARVIDPESVLAVGIYKDGRYVTIPVRDIVIGHGREQGRLILKPAVSLTTGGEGREGESGGKHVGQGRQQPHRTAKLLAEATLSITPQLAIKSGTKVILIGQPFYRNGSRWHKIKHNNKVYTISCSIIEL